MRRETTQKRRKPAPIFFPRFARTFPIGAPLMRHFTVCPVPLVSIAEHKSMPLVPQIARFAVVGVINTAVDLTVLNTLIAVSQRGRSGLLYSVFKATSFLVAVLNSYWLNCRWTFRQTAMQNVATRVGRFLSVSVLGLAINVGTASWVAAIAEPVRWLTRYWPSIAALAGAACGLGFNYAGYKFLVFRPPSNPANAQRSNIPHDSGDPFAPAIGNGLNCAAQRSLKGVERTWAHDQAATIPPNGTRQPPARVRLG